MMWARSISEFGAVLVLTSSPPIASVLVYRGLEMYGIDYVLPLVTLLMITCLVIFVFLRIIYYRGKRA
jgi:molybdate/tungstate transport system permease protein